MSTTPSFIPADFPGEITLDHLVPAAAAKFAPLPADLRPELVTALAGRGVERLYSHQAQAYEAVRKGRHLVVVTPTASGKTLCYNLPVLQRLLEDPEKRALYVYPTKALAQDQLAELGALKHGLPIDLRVDTYDGDTPPGRRTAIREGGHIVMTNPDMLHTGMLPHHTRWRRLFSSLEFVVIDELHTYRGLFGSQVANVIRRLKRICAFYGSRPLFICASATIRNPLDLAQRLLELPFEDEERLGRAGVHELLQVFEEDGSATRSGGRWFWSRQAFPAEEVHLRRILADNVVIIDTSQPRPQVIGEMDQFTAPVLLHEEAVYLHEGAQYHVDRLDWDEKKAYVRPVEVDYYTDALASVTVQVLDTFAGPEGDALTRSHGEVKITSLASMFKKIRFHTHENIGAGPIHLPEQTLHTTGYWITVDEDLWRSLGRETLEAGLQGMAHSLRHVASLRLMCDPRDLGAVAEVRSITTQLPTVTVYEVYPGGVGFSSRLFDVHRELLDDAAALVRECPCAAGCPSCVGPLHLVEGAKDACLKLLSASVLTV